MGLWRRGGHILGIRYSQGHHHQFHKYRHREHDHYRHHHCHHQAINRYHPQQHHHIATSALFTARALPWHTSKHQRQKSFQQPTHISSAPNSRSAILTCTCLFRALTAKATDSVFFRPTRSSLHVLDRGFLWVT